MPLSPVVSVWQLEREEDAVEFSPRRRQAERHSIQTLIRGTRDGVWRLATDPSYKY
jgi:hypothetical protein